MDLFRKLGEMNFDGLIVGTIPQIIVEGKTIRMGEAETTYKRGTILAKSTVDGKLVILGADAADAEAGEAKFSGTGTETVFSVEDKPAVIKSVKVGGTESDDWTYDASTGKITFGTAPAAGTDNIVAAYDDGAAEELVACGILTDDVTVGTTGDAAVTVYTAGCFNAEKVIVADDYTITEADKDALRKYGIILKAAFGVD